MEHAEATVSVPRLAPFAERGGVDLDGRATLTATIDRSGDEIRIAGNGTISAAGGEDPLSRLIGENARVVVNATINGSGRRALGGAAGGRIRECAVTGRVRATTSASIGRLGLDDLSLLTASLVGDLSAQGQLRGPWQTARLDATGVGNVGTPTIARQRIDISANATGFPRTESGTFTAQGRFDDAPLSLGGELARARDGLRPRSTAAHGRASTRAPTSRSRTTAACPATQHCASPSFAISPRLSASRSMAMLEAEIDFRRAMARPRQTSRRARRTVRYADATVRDLEANTTLNLQNGRSSARRARERCRPPGSRSARDATITGRIDEPFDAPSLALAIDAPALSAGEFTGDAKAQIGPTRRPGHTARLGSARRWAILPSFRRPRRLDLRQPANPGQHAASEISRRDRDARATVHAHFRSSDRYRSRASARGQRQGLGERHAVAAPSTARDRAERLDPLITPFLPALAPEGTISANCRAVGHARRSARHDHRGGPRFAGRNSRPGRDAREPRCARRFPPATRRR